MATANNKPPKNRELVSWELEKSEAINMHNKNEPKHDKRTKCPVRPSKSQISLGIRRVWSEVCYAL